MSVVPNCPRCQIVRFWWWCQIVRCQIVLVPNCPRCQIVRGAKLSWCQIVRCQIVRGAKLSAVPNCPRCQIVLVPNCPRCQIVRGAKLSGAKLSWCQIVRQHGRCQIVRGAKLSWCQIVLGPTRSPQKQIFFKANQIPRTANYLEWIETETNLAIDP